jgi:hypothetical protein
MSQKLFSVALVVHDYDDAIRYFTHCLRFTLLGEVEMETVFTVTFLNLVLTMIAVLFSRPDLGSKLILWK